MGQDLQFSSRPRRVTESSECRKYIRELFETYPRFREVLIAIRRDLQDFAHHEAISHPSLSGYFFKRTAKCFETPSFTYYYTYDDGSAEIKWIEVTDDTG